MARYTFIDSVTSKSGIDVHCTTENVMAKYGTNYDCQYVIGIVRHEDQHQEE